MAKEITQIVKKHFGAYNELAIQIEELNYKMIALKNELYSVRGVRYGEMPKGGSGNNNDIIFRIMEHDEIKAELEAMIQKKKALYQKHIEEIAKLKNERHRSIMRSIYLQKLSVKEVSNIIKLSTSHTFTMKAEAEQKFAEIIANNSI